MNLKKLFLSIFVSVIGIAPLMAQTYSFNNAGASGTTGPSQSQVNSAYTSTNLAGQVTVIGSGIQQWTVPATGTYTITAAGASGGYTPYAEGGRGRTISTQVSLTTGTVIYILVGQEGGRAQFSSPGYAGGGGGGTYIINNTTNTPILICGGGGGAGEGSANWGSPILPGVDASAYNNTSGESGTGYSGSWSSPGVGGSSGSGGGSSSGGAGGGGYSGNGSNGSYSGNPGLSYTNGGLGGTNRDACGGGFTINISGGFGGGAGVGICSNYEANGGGGGGYSGGGGSNTRVGAGGGGGNLVTGSFISSALNTGNGFVNITLVCDSITSISVTPGTLTNTGGVSTNLYIGYPNNSPSATVTAVGGSAVTWSPATYLNCSTCVSAVFAPTVAGTYTLTATNCKGSKTVTFCVKDIRVPNTSGTKAAVYLCHKEPVTNVTKTQAVLLRGIPSHFQYHSGDKLGVCGNTCATTKRDFDFENLVVDEQTLEVMCSPNPFHQSFKLHYISNSPIEAVVSIYGMTGNLVETVTLEGVADEAELGTNLPNGIYTISFIQGDKNRTFRMIKVD